MVDACKAVPDVNMAIQESSTDDLHADGRNNCAAEDAAKHYRLKRISVVVRVEKWILYRRYNNCICDRCIAKEIGISDAKKVAMATRKLALREPGFFVRWHGRCSSCGHSKSVILGRRLTWA